MARRIPINTPIHQGWNILWFRSLNGWSQDDLEEKSGISQREISDYEKMSVIPDNILQKFADAFETHIRYLRDVASYPPSENYLQLDNDTAQIFKDHAVANNNPLEAIKEMHESSTARLIEANNKLTYNLEKQIEELKAELKNWK